MCIANQLNNWRIYSYEVAAEKVISFDNDWRRNQINLLFGAAAVTSSDTRDGVNSVAAIWNLLKIHRNTIDSLLHILKFSSARNYVYTNFLHQIMQKWRRNDAYNHQYGSTILYNLE